MMAFGIYIVNEKAEEEEEEVEQKEAKKQMIGDFSYKTFSFSICHTRDHSSSFILYVSLTHWFFPCNF